MRKLVAIVCLLLFLSFVLINALFILTDPKVDGVATNHFDQQSEAAQNYYFYQIALFAPQEVQPEQLGRDVYNEFKSFEQTRDQDQYKKFQTLKDRLSAESFQSNSIYCYELLCSYDDLQQNKVRTESDVQKHQFVIDRYNYIINANALYEMPGANFTSELKPLLMSLKEASSLKLLSLRLKFLEGEQALVLSELNKMYKFYYGLVENKNFSVFNFAVLLSQMSQIRSEAMKYLKQSEIFKSELQAEEVLPPLGLEYQHLLRNVYEREKELILSMQESGLLWDQMLNNKPKWVRSIVPSLSKIVFKDGRTMRMFERYYRELSASHCYQNIGGCVEVGEKQVSPIDYIVNPAGLVMYKVLISNVGSQMEKSYRNYLQLHQELEL